MKLSMWIFVDWLRDYDLTVDIQSGKLEIDSVRLFSADMTPQRGTLYIGRKCDIFSSTQTDIICVHQNDIIMVSTNDVNEVLNHILDAVESYTGWINALSNMTAKGAMLFDLIQISHDLLPYPLMIFDSSQKAIAYSTDYKPGEVDPDFDKVMDSGSAHLERILGFNKFFPDMSQQRGIYYMDDQYWPHTNYSYNFYSGDSWIGTILVIELNQKMTQGNLDTFFLLSSYVEQWLSLHGQRYQSLQTDNLFRLALQNDDPSIEEIKRILLLADWKNEDEKCLFKLCSLSEVFNIHTHLCKTLRSSLDDIFVFSYDDSVVVLCNISKKGVMHYNQTFIPWLKKCSYYGCRSEGFRNIHLLFQYYIQTCITQKNCPKISGEIYDIRPFMLSYGAEIIKEYSPIPLVHPALLPLQNYDQEHRTELVKTLRTYLKNSCNQKNTADELSIHRSSLLYRLQRISEIMDTDFSDPYERLHMLFSLEYL